MMAEKQEVGPPLIRRSPPGRSKVARLKDAAMLAAIGALISIGYVAWIAFSLSSAFHLSWS
jgi:hypothetical protein